MRPSYDRTNSNKGFLDLYLFFPPLLTDHKSQKLDSRLGVRERESQEEEKCKTSQTLYPLAQYDIFHFLLEHDLIYILEKLFWLPCGEMTEGQ